MSTDRKQEGMSAAAALGSAAGDECSKEEVALSLADAFDGCMMPNADTATNGNGNGNGSDDTNNSPPSEAMMMAKKKKKKKKKRIRPKLKPVSSDELIAGGRGTPSPLRHDDLGFGHFAPSVVSASTGVASAASSSKVGTAKAQAASDEWSAEEGEDANVAENNTTMAHQPEEAECVVVATTPPIERTRDRPSASRTRIQPPLSSGSLREQVPPPPPHTPDDDNYDNFGFGLVKNDVNDDGKKESSVVAPSQRGAILATKSPDAAVADEVPSSPTKGMSLRRVLSSESYISDDSSSSDDDGDDDLLLHRNPTREEDGYDDGPKSTRTMEEEEEGGEGDVVVGSALGAQEAQYSPERSDFRSRHNTSGGSTTTERSAIRASSVSNTAIGAEGADAEVHMTTTEGGSIDSDNASFSSGGASFGSSSGSSSDGELSYFSAQRTPPAVPEGGAAAVPSHTHHHPRVPNFRSHPIVPSGDDHQLRNPRIIGVVPPPPPSLLQPHLAPLLVMRSTSAPRTDAASAPPASAGGPGSIHPSVGLIELKLSLSEEESGDNRIRTSSSSRAGDNSPAGGSTDSSNEEDAARKRNRKRQHDGMRPRSRGSGASSADDRAIANELDSYGFRGGGGDGSSPPSPSGRRAPVEDAPPAGGHRARGGSARVERYPGTPTGTPPGSGAPSPVKTFRSTPQSAVLARPRPGTAVRDSSFLANLREGFVSVAGGGGGGSVASAEGSCIFGSPGGAFGERTPPSAQEEPRMAHRADVASSEAFDATARSPHDLSVRTSSTHTIQSNLQSLAYSDEEDGGHHHHPHGRVGRGHSGSKHPLDGGDDGDDENGRADGKVYAFRWIVLLYVSMLNLIGGWTCFSVAPFPGAAMRALDVDPELLVVIFLTASVVGTAFEPLVLGRVGLRRTVLSGALLLMAGNMIKSGNVSTDRVGIMWSTYLGFALAGMGQPLYQNNAALLAATWFPRKDWAWATAAATDGHRVGIGCAFVFGVLYVNTQEDVLPYFHSIGVASLVLFIGVAMQVDDCPPTPPPGAAMVIQGTNERTLLDRPGSSSMRRLPPYLPMVRRQRLPSSNKPRKHRLEPVGAIVEDGGPPGQSAPLLPTSSSFDNAGITATTEDNAVALSAFDGPTELVMEHINETNAAAAEYRDALARAPSPAMPGPVTTRGASDNACAPPFVAREVSENSSTPSYGIQSYGSTDTGPSLTGFQFVNSSNRNNISNNSISNVAKSTSDGNDNAIALSYSLSTSSFPFLRGSDSANPRGEVTMGSAVVQPRGREVQPHHPLIAPRHSLPLGDRPSSMDDDGAGTVLMQFPRGRLDVEVRGDRIWLSLRACFARPGFACCVSAFAVSGVIANVLSTFMGHLISNGIDGDGGDEKQAYSNVGIFGGSFQLLIVVSSIMFRRCCTVPERYYMIVIALLALGTLALALCDANLDDGKSLCWNLLMVAAFVGPLQPISTRLGAEVAHPHSENTVSIVQQSISDLLSAACIPAFRVLRDYFVSDTTEAPPEFTFSFYLLVLIITLAAVHFASFGSQSSYHRREEEEEHGKKGGRGGGWQPQTHHHHLRNPSADYKATGAGADATYLQPKPRPASFPRDQPWKKKYPFLIPQQHHHSAA